MSVQFVLALCHHSNRPWPLMVHHSWCLSSHLSPVPILPLEGPSPAACFALGASTPHYHTHFQAEQEDHPIKNIFFIVSNQGPPLPPPQTGQDS